jgi:CheY-like chemotaxis protein
MTAEYHDQGGLRVLVVEDESDLAAITVSLLRLYGHEARTAADGEAALAVAQAEPPDVVLLDLRLPGALDGYAVARQLRQRQTGRRPVIVVISGFGEPEDRLRSYECGADMHLTKPVDPEELRALLARLHTANQPRTPAAPPIRRWAGDRRAPA